MFPFRDYRCCSLAFLFGWFHKLKRPTEAGTECQITTSRVSKEVALKAFDEAAQAAVEAFVNAVAQGISEVMVEVGVRTFFVPN
jgi:hypothetical protein